MDPAEEDNGVNTLEIDPDDPSRGKRFVFLSPLIDERMNRERARTLLECKKSKRHIFSLCSGTPSSGEKRPLVPLSVSKGLDLAPGPDLN
jgi:hypothetical protein